MSSKHNFTWKYPQTHILVLKVKIKTPNPIGKVLGKWSFISSKSFKEHFSKRRLNVTGSVAPPGLGTVLRHPPQTKPEQRFENPTWRWGELIRLGQTHMNQMLHLVQNRTTWGRIEVIGDFGMQTQSTSLKMLHDWSEWFPWQSLSPRELDGTVENKGNQFWTLDTPSLKLLIGRLFTWIWTKKQNKLF